MSDRTYRYVLRHPADSGAGRGAKNKDLQITNLILIFEKQMDDNRRI